MVKSELPPERLIPNYVKRDDDRWWLSIASTRSITDVADIERDLKQQDKTDALTAFQKYVDALAASSHFQQSHEQALLIKHREFGLEEIRAETGSRKLEALRKTVNFLQRYADTPELRKLRADMVERLKAIDVLSWKE